MDIKRAVIDLAPAPIVRFFAAPYVAGKGIESGVKKADEIWNARKLHATVDLLGEEVFKREDVEATVALYFRMVDALAGRPLRQHLPQADAVGHPRERGLLPRQHPEGPRVRGRAAPPRHRGHGGPALHRRHAAPVQGAPRRVRQRRDRPPDAPVPHPERHRLAPREVRAGCGSASGSTTSRARSPTRTSRDEGPAVRAGAAAARQGPLSRDRHARRAAGPPLPRVPRQARLPEERLRVPDAARRAAAGDPGPDRARRPA